jgi:hypothetical protein
MIPRTNDNIPRNESTVMIAIKGPESCDDDAASLSDEGDDVGDDDACWELEFDCALGADEVDVVAGDGSGVTGVTDTIVVDVGRLSGNVGVAGLAALCEVVVTDEAAGTTGDEERATIGGGREVKTGGTGGGRELTMGVSDDAGGITGGSPSVVDKIEGGLVTTGVTDGRTAGGAVGGSMSDDAGGVTAEGPAGIDKDEGQSLIIVATDGRTPEVKDRPVTGNVSCDAEGVDGDGHLSTGEDRG